MSEPLDNWASGLARLPIAFSQVREDPRIDIAVMAGLSGPLRGLIVASGGCTAAAVLGMSEVDHLGLVDPNPAQLALARFKIGMLGSVGRDQRLELLGHRPLEPAVREEQIRLLGERLGIDTNLFGDPADVRNRGPDHVGRYERVFEKCRDLLGSGDHFETMTDRGLEEAFIAALRPVFAQDILTTIFGPSATANRVREFADHFIERFRIALAMPDPEGNPFLNQVLIGSYGPVAADWFDVDPIRETREPVCHNAMMREVLDGHHADLNFVGLSNILDWLEPAEAASTLEAAARALRSGGAVVIRQLNSNTDIRGLGTMFDWDIDFSGGLHRGDRSFFYRDLHVGYRR